MVVAVAHPHGHVVVHLREHAAEDGPVHGERVERHGAFDHGGVEEFRDEGAADGGQGGEGHEDVGFGEAVGAVGVGGGAGVEGGAGLFVGEAGEGGGVVRVGMRRREGGGKVVWRETHVPATWPGMLAQ